MVPAPVFGALSSLRAAAVSLYRQRRNTVMIGASRGLVDKVLLPEFTELESALQVYLQEVTLRVIREEIYDDTSDAQEVPDALPSN
jgi:hypothetical protein